MRWATLDFKQSASWRDPPLFVKKKAEDLLIRCARLCQVGLKTFHFSNLIEIVDELFCTWKKFERDRKFALSSRGSRKYWIYRKKSLREEDGRIWNIETVRI